jgi:MFS family permease
VRFSHEPVIDLSFASLQSGELSLGLRLAGILALRMLGLFLVLPVFMVMATEVPGYSPALAGLAIGIYGLTQAVLQQPVGWLSDHWGRRRVMLLGLGVFAVGGVVAALAPSMGWLVAGRALQGCGAIAGVALAFAADHTRPEKRSLVMAMIGMGIGASFLLSIILSVPLASLIGLRGLFWFTAGLGLVGMFLLTGIPPDGQRKADVRQESGESGTIWPLAVSVFFLHALMTLFFVVLPGSLVARHGLPLAKHWMVYAPTMLLSAVLVFPLLRKLADRELEGLAVRWSFMGLGAAMLLFAMQLPMAMVFVAAVLFFLAFNLLEAAMPSLVSRLSTASGRGRKMGVYTTFQFLGAFAGGACGGWSLETLGGATTLWIAAAIAVVWALVPRPVKQG